MQDEDISTVANEPEDSTPSIIEGPPPTAAQMGDQVVDPDATMYDDSTSMGDENIAPDNAPMNTPGDIVDDQDFAEGNDGISLVDNSQPLTDTTSLYSGGKETVDSYLFEADALLALDGATTYEEGLEKLRTAYEAASWSDPEEAKQIYSDYGDKIRNKFKIKGLPIENTIELLPIKPSQFTSDLETEEERMVDITNQWAAANKKFLSETDDPDYLAMKDILNLGINDAEFLTNREIQGGNTGFITDLFYRAASGAVDPLSQLLTGENTDLAEQTNPKYDTNFSAQLAGAVGSVGAVIGGAAVGTVTGGPIGGVVAGTTIAVAQGAGSVRERYEDVLERTGNETRARQAASIEAVSQGFQLATGYVAGKAGIALGKAVTKTITGKAAALTEAEMLAKLTESPGKVLAKKAITGAAIEMAGEVPGQMLSNVSTNVGFEEDTSIWKGTGTTAAIAAILGGGLGGIEGVSDAYTRRITSLEELQALDELSKKQQAEVEEEETPETGVEGEKPKAPKPISDIKYEVDLNAILENLADKGPATENNAESPLDEESKVPKVSIEDLIEPIGHESMVGSNVELETKFIPESSSEESTERLEIESVISNISKNQPFLFTVSPDKLKRDLDFGKNSVRFIVNLMARGLEVKIKDNTRTKGSRGDGITHGYWTVDQVTGKPYVAVPRSGFIDQKSIITVLAHEIGHNLLGVGDYSSTKGRPMSLFDTYASFGVNSPELQQTFSRMKLVASKLNAMGQNAPNFLNEAAKLSAEWRPGWSGKRRKSGPAYDVYRSSSNEIMADIVSAALLRPDLVKSEHPNVWKFIDEVLTEDGPVGETWAQFKRLSEDPNALEDYLAEDRGKGYEQTAVNIAGKISKERETSAIHTKTQALKEAQERAHNLIKSGYQVFLNKTYALKAHARKLAPGPEKEGFNQILNHIEGVPFVRTFVQTHLEVPLKAWAEKAAALGIIRNDLSDYAKAEKVLYEETPYTQSIKEIPLFYQKFIGFLLNPLSTQAREDFIDILAAKKIQEDPKLRELTSEDDFKAALISLRDKIAKKFESDSGLPNKELGVLGQRLKSLLSTNSEAAAALNAFVEKGTPEFLPQAILRLLGTADVIKGKSAAASFQQSIDAYIKGMGKFGPEVRSEIDALFNKTSYNARKYLLNSKGDNVYDAAAAMERLRQKYGDKYKNIEDLMREYHEIVNNDAIIDLLYNSGIITPFIYKRMKLNKDYYTTNVVNDYIENDSMMDPQIKAAYGTFREQGDPLVGTPLKMQALIDAAFRQRAVNSLYIAAKAMGEDASEVLSKSGRRFPPQSMYEKMVAHNKGKDGSSTYIILKQKGTPRLFEIQNNLARWDHILSDFRFDKNGAMGIALGVTDALTRVSLTRELKTILSAAFSIVGETRRNALNEAMRSHSIITTPVFFFWHLNPSLRRIKKQIKADWNTWQTTGVMSPTLKDAFRDQALISHLNDTQTGLLPNEYDVARGIFDLANEGKVIEDAQKRGWDVQRISQTANNAIDKIGLPGDKIGQMMEVMGASNVTAKTAAKMLNKVGLKGLKDFAQNQEAKTKLFGYYMGRTLLKMSPPEAGGFARYSFGTPNSTSGGYYANEANRIFLFGRAWLNGLNNLDDYIRSDPKNAVGQLVTKHLIPKFLVTAAAPAMIGALFGEEAEKQYDLWLKKIPGYEKVMKSITPLGFFDSQGKFRPWLTFDSSEVTADWKAAYFRFSDDRTLAAINATIWPSIEALARATFDGADFNPDKVLKQTGIEILKQTGGNFNPWIQYGFNLAEIVVNPEGPTDLFRGRPIIDKKNLGSIAENSVEFGKYVVSQQLPGIVPSYYLKKQDSHSMAESMLNDYPVLSPTARSILGATNYGDYENTKAGAQKAEDLRQEILNGYGPASESVRLEYSSAQGFMSKAGAQKKPGGWREGLNPVDVEINELMLYWQSHIQTPFNNEIRNYMEVGDDENVARMYDELEKASAEYLAELERIRAPKHQTSAKPQP